MDKNKSKINHIKNKIMTDNLTVDSLLIELQDAKAKIAEYEEKERINYIKVIKRFGEKYTDKELGEKDLKDLKIIADACERYCPSTENPDILPMPKKRPSYEEAKKKHDGLVNFSSVFDDVSAQFDMTKIKTKK